LSSPASIAPPPAQQPAPDRAADWVAAGTPEPLRSQLVQTLGADKVLTRALDLVRYASDASPYRLIPKAVAMPHDAGDVARLMKLARERSVPITFRAGGTSLNGQAQTDSVLVDVRRHWQRARVLEDGRAVRVSPGMVLGHVNRLLARHGRKLGPDPASTDIACVGGVIANNSGGMRCGVTADSYSTVRSMTLVLTDGTVIDTAVPGAGERFAAAAPKLARGLIELREELRGDRELSERVARKFQIKNTMGYRLCALLDADEPLEIFRRLVIGSEGTLAFVAEAVFDTVPFGGHASAALAIFEDIDAAAEVVPSLVDSGASATELMFASTLLAAAYNMPGTPEHWKSLPPDCAALLIEYRADAAEHLGDPERRGLEILRGARLLGGAGGAGGAGGVRFSREREELETLWRVREGIQGLIAGYRPPGVSLIIEDVCVPPARIAEACRDLQALLAKHEFLPGLAGHASAGNLHFLLTPNFGEPADLERYDAFVHELAELILDKYDGSLKAEHGTGTNMPPFVEREWGPKATEMMWRIKRLADPDGILSPGVVLSRDEGVHLRNLKSTPEIEEVATKCVECGFCEPVCPSRNVTTTPRQRIALRREMARQPAGSPVLEALLEQYEYDAIDTCAADGSCALACPVAIDTGKLVTQLRHRRHSERAERGADEVAKYYGIVERAARAGVRAGAPALRLRNRALPGAAPELPFTVRDGAAAVYLPSCINRIVGSSPGTPARPSVPYALVAISQRAGLPLWIPDGVVGNCCGLPWSSKGFERGHRQMAARTAASLRRWVVDSELPVVIDATSCAHELIQDGAAEGLQILDSIAWVHDHLLDRLEISRKLGGVAVHPPCSARHLGLVRKLAAIASRMSDEVVVPAAAGCCGMAGDRGVLHPELPASALRDVASELDGRSFDACLCSNRTCEIALQDVTGLPYASFVLALEELTRG
jgi:D-lactate dehydrogenase